jgi:preprotein translocase subunit SecA
MAQRDPLVEYQREGYDMFTAMLDGLKEESVGFLFNINVEVTSPAEDAAGTVAPQAAPEGLAEFASAAAQAAQGGLRAKGLEESTPELTYSGPAEDGSAQSRHEAGGDDSASGGGTRRERREAARNAGRTSKPPRSRRKR